ncbi:zinc finger BED domain-containing protein DAYSLEEPER-like [Neltuma alba]|uniref:zinc finger BED domain-containing protein DAYSLEEPER-like n=1 Tax=Neltuma alba TaxID=207710 RepID=UPI0010A39B52|nr:zinc finger BED domain-containing protein DAYSLEEPER-like [Prosopis alba]
MAMRMVDKFDKYWNEYNYSVILALAIILDPRMKFDVIKFTYAQLDPINYNDKIQSIRTKLYNIFNEYKSMGSSSSTSTGGGGESSYSNVNVSGPTASSSQSTHVAGLANDNDHSSLFLVTILIARSMIVQQWKNLSLISI